MSIENNDVTAGATAAVPAGDDFIKSRIFSLRGVQVMLDRDLAMLYGVEVKQLNRQVKRNIERFPADFMFQLSLEECSRCQFVTLNSGRGGNIKYRPYAFTENGVAMLSGILRSPSAIATNIRIMRAFNAMRQMLASMMPFVTRLDAVERRQIADQTRNEENQQRNEERFDAIFKAMDGGDFPEQKVFFEGRHYDAYSFARKLVKKAVKRIVLVDGYCDETTLDILAQKRGGVEVVIATTEKTAAKHLTPVVVEKFNKQNATLAIMTTGAFHDRFVVIDHSEIYLFGASLKDLGRKYCAVVRMEPSLIPSILEHIGLNVAQPRENM